MANDGSIRFATEIDNSKAYRELEKLNQRCQKLQNDLTKAKANRDSIIPNLNDTYAKLDEVVDKIKYLKEKVASSTGDKKILYKEELSDALYEQRALNKEATKLETAYNNANKKVDKLKDQLDTAQAEAGAVEKRMEMQRVPEALGNALDTARSKIRNFLKYAIGITTLVALFNRLRTAIKNAVSTFAANDAETRANIDGLKQSLETLRASWGAAFAPILNAVTPILQTLISWLTAAAQAIANFLAVLGGRSTYKKAIANNNKLAGSIGGAGGAAQEAKKQLAGFDELNILNDDRNAGGGGGGGGGTGIEFEEEEVKATGFALAIKKIIEEIKDLWQDLRDLFSGDTTLKDFVQQLTPLQTVLIGIAGAIAGVGAAIVVAGIIDKIKTINTLTGGTLSTLTGIGLILGGAITAIITFYQQWIDGCSNLKMAIMWIGIAAAAVGAILLGAPALVATIIALIVASVATLVLIIRENWDQIIATLKEDWENIKMNAQEFGTALKDYFTNIWEAIKTWAIEKWNQISDFFIQTWNNINEKAHAKFQEMRTSIITPLEDARDKIKGIIDKIKSFFNFQFTWPHIPLPHFQVSPAGWNLNNLFRGIIPSFGVSWYARGGIVDGATLIGAGEAGKEAIVPLERHTEWIDMVADSLLQKLSQRSFADALAEAFINTPMPALAMGAVLPPNAAYASGGGDWTNNLLTKVNELQEAVSRLASQPVQVDSRMYIDKRQIGQAVSEYQRSAARAGGK